MKKTHRRSGFGSHTRFSLVHSLQVRTTVIAAAVLLGSTIMFGQSAPAGGGGTSCYHMHANGDCGSNETSSSYLNCSQESCPDWYTVAGEIYECVGCQGPDGYICTNHGHVSYLKYVAYCTVPEGLCDYEDPITLAQCISAVATAQCECPP